MFGKRLLSAIFAVALILGGVPFFAYSAEITDGEATLTDPTFGYREEQEINATTVPYTEIELGKDIKDILVGVDGDVELLVLSSENDLYSGELLEYYNDFYSKDAKVYEDLVNTLKTIAEYNDFITLKFVDPYSVYSQSTFSKHKSYDLEYGDMLISCYCNFDGNAKTRRKALKAKSYFSYKTDARGKKCIKALKVEKKIASTISSLRNTRNINVAYLEDLCIDADIKRIEDYLDSRGYDFTGINFNSDKLQGYDMIVIASPFRDVTLEEMLILDAFLNNNGKRGKMISYFAPKEYVNLTNLYSFISRWGIAFGEDYRLSCVGNDGYFIDETQLYAKSEKSYYTELSDKKDGFYIMDKCTPMTVSQSKDSDVSVTTLLSAEAKKLELVNANPNMLLNKENLGTLQSGSYPLLAISSKGDSRAKSHILSCASSDFLTTYFALQNDKNEEEKGGELCGNFGVINEIFDKLNAQHIDEKSGLEEYAIGISELGIDATSGLSRNFILAVAFGGAAFMIIGMFILLIFMNRRKKVGTGEE